ncbi:MAG: class I SAM-dependent methyltransferase [Candidatus Aenigmatarchaeota archaeon]
MQLKEVYEEIAESWSNLRNKPVSFVPFDRIKGSVLDIGCGNARNIIPLTKKGLWCVGVDFSKNMIKNAIKLCQKNNLEIDFVLADAFRLPFKSKIFDNCICIATLHHLETREKRIQSLKEINSVSKNHIYISVWYRWQVYHLINLIKNFWRFGDVYVNWRKKNKVLKRFYHLYTKKEFEKDILSAGLKIKEIKIIEENKKKNLFAYCKASK